MQIPDDLVYTEEHEWIRTEDSGVLRLGITDYAQDQLGDIVYVELPDVGATLDEGAIVSEVESTKSVGEVYAPVGGTVAAVNDALTEQPELVNSDPYGDGWLVEMEPSGDVPEFLDAAAYRALTE